jgi:hypothetical protein
MFWFKIDLSLVNNKTHLDNTNDDKRWGKTKILKCQQGTTKWQ